MSAHSAGVFRAAVRDLTSAERSQLPQPPSMRARTTLSAKHWVVLTLFIGTIAAGAFHDADDTWPSVGRIAVIYLFLTAAFRLMGKRELSALSPLELMALLLIPEIASSTLAGDAPLIHTLVGISTLLLLVFVISVLTARFKTFARAIESSPVVLIADGVMCEDALSIERVTPEELYGEMRKHGLQEISEVKWAILESCGEISFIPKRAQSLDFGSSTRRIGM